MLSLAVLVVVSSPAAATGVPTITDFSPTKGAPGTTVTIDGTDLSAATDVLFNGTSAGKPNIVSDTQITTTVPSGATTGPITVMTPDGNATSLTSFVVPPTITDFSPTKGGPGTSVTIDGTDLSAATDVLFNGTSAGKPNIVSDTQITTTVPSGATTGPITVVTPDGNATSPGDFLVPIHIVVIMEENKPYGRIVGNTCCPFINNTMISNGLLATDDHAITTGSAHDYFALTDGLTSSSNGRADNIFNQLQVAGVTWKAYEETMPSPCYLGKTYGDFPYLYVKGHDPAVSYKNITTTPACANNVVPLDPNLSNDIATGSLPSFSFITPNECDDMHSCSAAQGDAWLSTWVPRIAGAIGPDGVILLTWDEGGKVAQHVPLVEYGPGVAASGVQGTTYDAYVNHYGELAGIELNWGFPLLNNAATASPLPIP